MPENNVSLFSIRRIRDICYSCTKKLNTLLTSLLNFGNIELCANMEIWAHQMTCKRRIMRDIYSVFDRGAFFIAEI